MRGDKTFTELKEQYWVEFLRYGKAYNDELIAIAAEAEKEQRPMDRLPAIWYDDKPFWEWFVDNKLNDLVG